MCLLKQYTFRHISSAMSRSLSSNVIYSPDYKGEAQNTRCIQCYLFQMHLGKIILNFVLEFAQSQRDFDSIFEGIEFFSKMTHFVHARHPSRYLALSVDARSSNA